MGEFAQRIAKNAKERTATEGVPNPNWIFVTLRPPCENPIQGKFTRRSQRTRKGTDDHGRGAQSKLDLCHLCDLRVKIPIQGEIHKEIAKKRKGTEDDGKGGAQSNGSL